MTVNAGPKPIAITNPPRLSIDTGNPTTSRSYDVGAVGDTQSIIQQARSLPTSPSSPAPTTLDLDLDFTTTLTQRRISSSFSGPSSPPPSWSSPSTVRRHNHPRQGCSLQSTQPIDPTLSTLDPAPLFNNMSVSSLPSSSSLDSQNSSNLSLAKTLQSRSLRLALEHELDIACDAGNSAATPGGHWKGGGRLKSSVSQTVHRLGFKNH